MSDMGSGARRSASHGRVRHSRSTFIVEAMLLLACLLVVLAASMSLFAFAWQQGSRTADDQRAATLAQNVAERFAADPFSIQPYEEVDGLQVHAQLEWESETGGQIAYATITITHDEEPDPLFELSTARYVPNEAAGTAPGDTEEVLS